MLIEQPSKWLRRLYPGALWRVNPEEKAVYLTFDDGPIPEVTPWVLDLLDRYGVKATFFMVGDNICKHPDMFREVVERGHRIGNHTFNHIRGFSRKYFTSYSYLENTEKAYDLMRDQMRGLNCSESQLRPLLFRPPHGHMGWAQYITLKRRYRIVMWDLVTRDYSKKLRGPQVLANVLRYTRNGSIITFHDSIKSWKNGNLQYALPRAIEFFMEEGYQMKML
ncbi:MAG: polysaccharide deacetylase family protein [Bacteroides sp.]